MANSARPTSTDLLTKLINLPGHTFAVGQVLVEKIGVWSTAQADSLINCAGSWIVSIVVDANSFYVTQTGWVNNLTGPYTVGIQYYLSPTSAGNLTATKPITVGQVLFPCFVPDTATSGFFYGGSGELITSGAFRAWHVVTINQTMVANEGYVTNDVGSVSLAIPAAFSVGDEFAVMAHSAGGFQITMPPSFKVYDVGVGVSTTAGGTITSTVQGNTITFVGVIDSTDPNPALRVLNSKGALTYA